MAISDRKLQCVHKLSICDVDLMNGYLFQSFYLIISNRIGVFIPIILFLKSKVIHSLLSL